MKNPTDNPTNQSPALDELGPGDADAADRRRRGLTDFLQARHLRVADLARSIGLSTANAFYNFLHGRSDNLSLRMIEMILDFYPGTTFDELVGRQSRRPPPPPQRAAPSVPGTVLVRSEARAGLWRSTVDLPLDRQVILPLPHTVKVSSSKAFGVAVGMPGAERAYPAGALLLARTYDGREGTPPDSTRVIVHRRRGPRVEVTIREIVTRDGELWLESCSTREEHRAPLQPSLPLARGRPAGGIDIVDIAGVVVWAWVPQPGTTIT